MFVLGVVKSFLLLLVVNICSVKLAEDPLMKCRLVKKRIREVEFSSVEFPEGALLVASIIEKDTFKRDRTVITIYYLEPAV